MLIQQPKANYNVIMGKRNKINSYAHIKDIKIKLCHLDNNKNQIGAVIYHLDINKNSVKCNSISVTHIHTFISDTIKIIIRKYHHKMSLRETGFKMYISIVANNITRSNASRRPIIAWKVY